MASPIVMKANAPYPFFIKNIACNCSTKIIRSWVSCVILFLLKKEAKYIKKY